MRKNGCWGKKESTNQCKEGWVHHTWWQIICRLSFKTSVASKMIHYRGLQQADKGLTREAVQDEEEEEAEGAEDREEEKCALVGRDLPWEKSRSERVGREKLGHVEKSSCNDPNQEPAQNSRRPLSYVRVHPIFSSFPSDSWGGRPPASLHFISLTTFSFPSSLSPASKITHPTVKQGNEFHTSSNGVTLVQGGSSGALFTRQDEDKKKNREAKLKTQQRVCDVAPCMRIRQTNTKHTNTDQERQEELAWHFLWPRKIQIVSKYSTTSPWRFLLVIWPKCCQRIYYFKLNLKFRRCLKRDEQMADFILTLSFMIWIWL